MSHSPKLEVYKVILKPRKNEDKTFRDFLCEKFDFKPEGTNTDIFFAYFDRFIKSVDNKDFIGNKAKQKAFTAYDTAITTEGDTATITPHSYNKIIEGTIEGGKYGLNRKKSSLANKLELEPIDAQNIILDKFYFLLYTPFDSRIGILLLQSYSSETISDIFSDFMGTFFTHTPFFIKPAIEKFVPEEIREEFKKSSTVQKFSYSTRYLDKDIPGTPFEDEESQTLTVKVEITASKGIEKHRFRKWAEKLENGTLYNKKLKDFTDKKGYLKNEVNNKPALFKLDSDFEIRPIIPLENIINIVDGTPNFKELRDYCLALLEDTIIPEVYKRDAVTER